MTPNRYRGRACGKHPKLKGARYKKSGTCCQCSIDRVTAYRATDRGRRNVLNNNRRRKYGIEPEAFENMLRAQGGRCAVCRTDVPGGRSNCWALDHDHITGRPRGVLCPRCNVGIGNLGDDPDRVEAAAKYLRAAA